MLIIKGLAGFNVEFTLVPGAFDNLVLMLISDMVGYIRGRVWAQRFTFAPTDVLQGVKLAVQVVKTPIQRFPPTGKIF